MTGGLKGASGARVVASSLGPSGWIGQVVYASLRFGRFVRGVEGRAGRRHAAPCRKARMEPVYLGTLVRRFCSFLDFLFVDG
jgi:hypothetical protein